MEIQLQSGLSQCYFSITEILLFFINGLNNFLSLFIFGTFYIVFLTFFVFYILYLSNFYYYNYYNFYNIFFSFSLNYFSISS